MTTDYRALAEQPVRPTDEELLHIAAISIEPYERSGIATGEYEPETECAVEVYGSELIAYARAVLARWGNPAPQPVPVSERPWERQGWCDKYGRCWFGWGRRAAASWSFCKPSERDTATVSIPVNALPLPEQEVNK